MQNAPEFAEEYTAAERVRLVVIYMPIVVAIVAIGKLWLFPWMNEFSASAPCLRILGIKGTVVLFHGLFVGIPLFGAISTAATIGCRGYKILRDGQSPPAGEKVFRPTRIERGAKAKLRGYVHVLAAMPFVALAIWGSFEAGEAERLVRLKPVNCAHEKPLKGDVNSRP